MNMFTKLVYSSEIWANENLRLKSKRNMSCSAKKLKDWFKDLLMVMGKGYTPIPLFSRFFFE
jgi:hypothetical protein